MLLHVVYLKSSLVSGPLKVGIRLSLPFEEVHLILGNDIAGDKLVSNPVVTEKPCLQPCRDPVDEVFLSLYPACVVTRAMSKKIQEKEEEVKLVDTVIRREFNGEPLKTHEVDAAWKRVFHPPVCCRTAERPRKFKFT